MAGPPRAFVFLHDWTTAGIRVRMTAPPRAFVFRMTAPPRAFVFRATGPPRAVVFRATGPPRALANLIAVVGGDTTAHEVRQEPDAGTVA